MAKLPSEQTEVDFRLFSLCTKINLFLRRFHFDLRHSCISLRFDLFANLWDFLDHLVIAYIRRNMYLSVPLWN